jgi:hypothetical protein
MSEPEEVQIDEKDLAILHTWMQNMENKQYFPVQQASWARKILQFIQSSFPAESLETTFPEVAQYRTRVKEIWQKNEPNRVHYYGEGR